MSLVGHKAGGSQCGEMGEERDLAGMTHGLNLLEGPRLGGQTGVSIFRKTNRTHFSLSNPLDINFQGNLSFAVCMVF